VLELRRTLMAVESDIDRKAKPKLFHLIIKIIRGIRNNLWKSCQDCWVECRVEVVFKIQTCHTNHPVLR
jgi:hypothetical protein